MGFNGNFSDLPVKFPDFLAVISFGRFFFFYFGSKVIQTDMGGTDLSEFFDKIENTLKRYVKGVCYGGKLKK